MTTPGRRGRDKTLLALNQAWADLRRREERITISAVARLADVTPALLHNRYPGFVEQIRRGAGMSLRMQLTDLRQQLTEAKARIQEASEEIKGLKKEMRDLASENESLRRSAVPNGAKNVVRMRPVNSC